MKEKHTPSAFMAMFRCRGKESDHLEDVQLFKESAGLDAKLSLSTRDFLIYTSYSDNVSVHQDEVNRVTILLHGEVYDDAGKYGSNVAADLVKDYLQKSIVTFAMGLNGSFAILLVDERKGLIAVITDIVNSRTVFHSKHGDAFWISTSLENHPKGDCDPAGVASYIMNGFICLGRTVFKGVRRLERARVHLLASDGFRGTEYWTYSFSNAHAKTKPEDMRAELRHLLVRSMKRRMREGEQVFLSLSGGFDSRGVLGLVLDQGVQPSDLICLSYGSSDFNDDIEIPRELARRFAFQHRVLYYGKDIVATIQRNAECGQGLVNFLFSLDVLFELSQSFAEIGPAVLFVGDECFGSRDVEFSSLQEVLSLTFGIRDPVRLPRYMASGGYNLREVREQLQDDVSKIKQKCPPFDDWHDYKDFIYLDQYLPNLVMTWREYYAGRFITVRNPFVDMEILDFLTKVPSIYRRGKRLYKETITEMFPDLFGTRTIVSNTGRARTTNDLDNLALLRSQRTHILERVVSQYESKLDELLPPQSTEKLLLGFLESSGGATGSPGPWNGRFASATRALVKKMPFAYELAKALRDRMGDGVFSPDGINMQALERVLLIRHVLRIT